MHDTATVSQVTTSSTVQIWSVEMPNIRSAFDGE